MSDHCPICRSSDVSGLEFPGIYDGVLIWQCGKCNHNWPRFSEGRYHSEAERILDSWREHSHG